MSKSTKYGVVGVVIVAVLAFVVSGVLAATSITVNTGNRVTIGAGSAFATSCDETVTATPLLTFNTSNGTYQLTTISVKDINGIGAGNTGIACANKTLNLAFLNNGTAYYASWTIPSDADANEYHFGSRSGGNSGSIYFATSTFSAQSAATLTSIALTIN